MEPTTKIDTIEEYSLYALDRSGAGLDKICADSRECARRIITNDQGFIPRISALATDLHAFDLFQHDLCSFFMLETDNFNNRHENLAETQTALKQIMGKMSQHIENNRIDALADLLDHELPEILERFKILLPQVGAYIRHEYLQTA